MERVAGRYRLEALLGRGGSGTVWSALDERTGEDVALKLLDVQDRERIRAIRREVNALRWLRLPGVVRLRDDGLEDGRYFIAMDAVAGLPFPGMPGVMPWERLRPVLLRLVEVLARVHLAGVVHRDLKPANVVVAADGRVVMLDFGLALGERLTRHDPRGFAGTPRYSAPEQCRGEPCGPEADLYAVGVMAFEALSGQTPHQAADLGATLRLRGCEPAPPLASLVPGCPPPAAALVDRLLALDPAGRPDMDTLLDALGGRPTVLPEIPARPTTRTLRRIFAGPDCFLLRDLDAARLLRARAGLRADAIAEELHAWVRADLARPDPDGRWVVERAALAQLEAGLRLPGSRTTTEHDLSEADHDVLASVRLAWPHARPRLVARLLDRPVAEVRAALLRLGERGLVWPLARGRVGAAASGEPAPGWPAGQKRAIHLRLAQAVPRGDARIRHLLAGGARPESVLKEILAVIASAEGPAGAALLDLGLRLAHEADDTAAEAQILRRWTIWALNQRTTAAIDEALLALGETPGQEALHALLRGRRAVLARDPERARREIARATPFEEEDLEELRLSVQVEASTLQGLDAQATSMEVLAAWAHGRPSREVWAWSGLASLRTLQGRFEEALALSARCLAARPPARLRVQALGRHASALMAMGRHAEARPLLELMVRASHKMRDGHYISQATWILRHCRYQAGEDVHPRPELVEAARAVRPRLAAAWAYLEAILAWRANRPRLLAQLADTAARGFGLTPAFEPGTLLIALALTFVAKAPVSMEQASAVADQALALTSPSEAIQVLGLLRRAVASPPEAWRAHIEARASTIPPERWSQRLDVMSVDEALA